MHVIPAELCIKCKGHKYLCGLSYCPIMERFRSMVNSLQRVKISNSLKLVEGSTPPSAIVGERGYPKVPLILNIPPSVYGDEAKKYENIKEWWGKLSLGDIIKLRSSLISSITKIKVEKAIEYYNTEIPLAVVSERPVTSEAKLNTLEAKLRFDGVILPRGAGGLAEEIKIVDNPKLPSKLDKLIFDDIKASNAILELYKYDIDYYKIINALSFGLLGRKRNRRFVPTRWAITAVDSTVSKYLHDRIIHYNEINKIEVYYASYLGNYFYLILYPSKYKSLWIEIWHPLSLWSKELTISELTENYWGDYEYIDGGYMAARLAVLEYLDRIKRQAGIIIVREITEEYFAPVGNWHIRETVRKATENKIGEYESLSEALSVINNRLKAKINLFELNSIKALFRQKLITDF
ncbi:MAG: Nre family DNA repair protein [Saccharolobus sp.]|uniref:Nre family DNA repair protein n=1 Tax=Saccharolobus sp. TaxID=2100761 RepID=UPI0028CE2814|nr:Nre family DNA repair protein [Saccharolobus sp.]MDT7861161.1 Nre family DNA repair protein [Saccharolobus sp.]